jgi:membrane protease YdiL (CAAX protease family)
LIATAATIDTLTVAVLTIGTLLLATWVFLAAKGRDPARIGPSPDTRIGISEAVLVYLLGFMAQITGAQAGSHFFRNETGLRYLVSYVGPTMVAALAFFVLVRRRKEHGPRAKGAVAGVLGWLAWFPVVYAVFTATQLLWDAAGWSWQDQRVLEDLRTVPAWQFLVIAVGLAPVYEEVIFRGLLYPALRRRLPRGSSVVLCAACFALVHFSPAQMPALFVLGLALAWLYERTGTLAAPIAFHAAFNGFTFLSEMLKG